MTKRDLLSRALFSLCFLTGIAGSQRAAADEPPPATADTPPAQDQGRASLGSHQSNWQASLGVRTDLVRNPGFDPYAKDDALVQASLGFSRTLFVADRLSLAAATSWDFGSRSASARGAATQLDTQRFVLGPEVRFHLIPQLYFFARVVPGVLRTVAAMSEPTGGATLYSRNWAFALDGSAGTAVQLYGRVSGASNEVRLWALGDVGYGWSVAHSGALSPDEDSGAPQRVAALDLGPMAIRGAMFRLSAALTF